MTPFTTVTLQERPDLLEMFHEVQSSAWPEFLMHEAVASRYWHQLLTKWPQFQFALLDTTNDQVVAVGNSTPVHWVGDIRQLPDAGWDWAVQSGVEQNGNGNMQCALSIAILPSHRGRGLSPKMVASMKDIGKKQGFTQLIAPLRPNVKKQYPLIPARNYVQWTRDDGQPFDPWIRVHIRSGAKIVKVCPRSMTVSGTIEEWETWTKMYLPESGLYTLDGGLVPMKIIQDKNCGIYVEPNVWVVYDLTAE